MAKKVELVKAERVEVKEVVLTHERKDTSVETFHITFTGKPSKEAKEILDANNVHCFNDKKNNGGVEKWVYMVRKSNLIGGKEITETRLTKWLNVVLTGKQPADKEGNKLMMTSPSYDAIVKAREEAKAEKKATSKKTEKKTASKKNIVEMEPEHITVKTVKEPEFVENTISFEQYDQLVKMGLGSAMVLVSLDIPNQKVVVKTAKVAQ